MAKKETICVTGGSRGMPPARPTPLVLTGVRLMHGLVELGGVEPPSKQLTDVLSTCLSGDWLSGRLRTSAPKAALIL